jgi:hypothetical protein
LTSIHAMLGLRGEQSQRDNFSSARLCILESTVDT